MWTLGSLFDGIGGFPLATVHNGIKPVWASEVEAFPIRVTKIHFPEIEHLGDITSRREKYPSCGYYLRRQPLSGFVRSREKKRAVGRTVRIIYGTGADRKGDEGCRWYKRDIR